MESRDDQCRDESVDSRQYELQKTVRRLKTQKTNSQNFTMQRNLTNLTPKRVKIDHIYTDSDET
jgi:hypothetical protein